MHETHRLDFAREVSESFEEGFRAFMDLLARAASEVACRASPAVVAGTLNALAELVQERALCGSLVLLSMEAEREGVDSSPAHRLSACVSSAVERVLVDYRALLAEIVDAEAAFWAMKRRIVVRRVVASQGTPGQEGRLLADPNADGASGDGKPGRRSGSPRHPKHHEVLGRQERTRKRRTSLLRALPADSNKQIVARLDQFGHDGPDDSTVSKDIKHLRAAGVVHATKLDLTAKGHRVLAKLTT